MNSVHRSHRPERYATKQRLRNSTTAVLEQLKPHFKEALPRLRRLLHDDQRIHSNDLATVGEAARAAFAKLEAMP